MTLPSSDRKNGQEFRLVKFILIFFIGLLYSPAFGQIPDDDSPFFENNESRDREKAPPARERLFFGGSFGLQFGTLTDIQVAPVIGYWVLPRLAVAAGPNYRYFKYGSRAYGDRTHIYGGKAYMEFTLLRNINSVIPIGANTDIIFHLEDELLSLESSFFTGVHSSERFYVNTILAGGGLSQMMGRRSALNIIVLWALNESEDYGLYSNPEIRFSFVF